MPPQTAEASSKSKAPVPAIVDLVVSLVDKEEGKLTLPKPGAKQLYSELTRLAGDKQSAAVKDLTVFAFRMLQNGEERAAKELMAVLSKVADLMIAALPKPPAADGFEP